MPFQPLPSNPAQPTTPVQYVHPSAGYQRKPKGPKRSGPSPVIGVILLAMMLTALAAAWLYGTRPRPANDQTGAGVAVAAQVDGGGDPLSGWTIETSIERWWNTSTADSLAVMCNQVATDWYEAWAWVQQIDPVEASKDGAEARAKAELARRCGVAPEVSDDNNDECEC
jgi:hypothetical protein